MEIRVATVDDWERSKDIRLRALAEAPNAFCSSLDRELAFEDQAWRDRLEQARTFLALSGGATVGTATGTADPHENGGRELVAMWVDPAERRSGVARALIDAVVEWARAQNAPAVALWVAEDNASALRLYEKCGFALTGEREVMRSGVDQVRMRRPLTQAAGVVR